jgi:hypothetical protein
MQETREGIYMDKTERANKAVDTRLTPKKQELKEKGKYQCLLP